ncbi:hypothetical protein IKQ19_06585 [Candidatus Saccharibacteria bacterium]|nr:hypothetical protein [Candidatus Saccharibacteria bacterium]
MKLLCMSFVVCAAFGFYSCGGDGSNNSVTDAPDEITSSEQHELFSSSGKADSVKKRSSSSAKLRGASSSENKSSSSTKPEESSSSEIKGSSSVKPDGSSSSEIKSSSSVKPDGSSSSEIKSSSSVKPDGSSSSEVKSSSSAKPEGSSSSENKSSSSAKLEESSSSIVEGSSSAIETSSNSQEVTGVCKTELEDRCTYGSLYDERDGQTYKTVKIGEQWWMAENLRYNDSTQSVCFTDDPNCDVFGRFYNRNGALNDCPEGWHLPTEKEWLKLGQFVREHSEKGYPGQNLRADSLWNVSGLGTGYDAFGFGAIPAGGYDAIDGWWKSGQNALFWMSDSYKSGSQNCYTYTRLCYKVYKDDSDLIIGKSGGLCVRYSTSKYSVRCIKD